MKTPAKFLLLLAAISFAFVSRSQAQLITETLSSWAGNTVNFQPTASEGTLGQTFTGLTKINSLTYAFVSNLANPTTGNLSYKFGEWNGSTFTNTLINTTPLTVSGSNFTTSLPGGYANVTDGQFNLSSYVLDPSKTYALLFTSSVNQNFGLGWIGGNVFQYGKAYDSAGNLGASVDYAFAYISVEVPPVPESSTVAAIIGATLVAGLVGFRLRQRRQLAAVTAANA